MSPVPGPMRSVRVTAFTSTSCAGRGNAALLAALEAQRSGLAPLRFMSLPIETFTGEVAGTDEVSLGGEFADDDCRNNRLASIGLEQDGFAEAAREAVARHGADRVGVFVGTSTSGLLQTELAYRRRAPDTGRLPADFSYEHTHNTFSLGDFVRRRLGVEGPASVASAACASSAKVFGAAERAMRAGLIDAAIVGGVDTLCLTTLYGFGSLELLSRRACRPWDRDRDGISIGEAAAFALLEAPGRAAPDDLLLVGFGESSDAHHMSSPHPEGDGARRAMQQALGSGGLQPRDIDYVNLHGTATPNNDAAEDLAVWSVFEGRVPVSSTKGTHGHTLGAAGGLEAVVSLLALRHGLAPGGVTTGHPDPALRTPYLRENRRAPLRRVMSNSFGFGGSNCTLVFARADASGSGG